MIEAWLHLPAVGLFAVLIVTYAFTGILWSWLSFWSPLSPRVRTLNGVVGPYFGSVGILFSLLTGFLASDIADQQRLAWQAVHNEASAIITVFTLSSATSSDMEKIRAALHAYAEAVVTDEWPKLAEPRRSALVDKTMSQLLSTVSDSAITSEAGQALHNNLLRTALNIREARASRLAIAFAQTRQLNWATVPAARHIHTACDRLGPSGAPTCAGSCAHCILACRGGRARPNRNAGPPV
jgi:hypothetical protein